MLTGAGFSDDPLLAHPFREQDLAECVVDFVGAGVKEVLPFEVDFCAA